MHACNFRKIQLLSNILTLADISSSSSSSRVFVLVVILVVVVLLLLILSDGH